jgi:hypothetical protein
VGALLSVVFDGGLFEAEPLAQAWDEAVAFGELVEAIDDGAVHEAEDSGVGCIGEIGEAAEEGIEEAEAQGARAALGAGAALGDDDGEAFAPLVDELWDDFGGVLEVAVEEDDGVAAGVVDTGGDGGLVAEISGKGEELDAGVGGVGGAEEGG